MPFIDWGNNVHDDVVVLAMNVHSKLSVLTDKQGPDDFVNIILFIIDVKN